MATLTERNEWTERYRFVSVRGTFWNRAMVRAGVMRYLRYMRPEGKALDEVLDDDKFMRGLRGLVPARVIEAVWMEARIRGQ